MSRGPSPTAKRSKPNAKRTAPAKQPERAIDAQPMRLVPSPEFDVDNLAFDRGHRPRVDDLPPRPPRKARTPTRCTVGYAFYEAEPGRPHSQRIPSVRDVPPILSSASVWSPIPYPEEIGREE
ncbi:hypothetical protein VDG44_20545, partial [Xanthomonas campestris pv. raphani]|uniref:hypothetical protein n=1 Tax=Xanthomonas campestris TaxID=339 RepID=UPI002B23DBF5